MTPQFYVYLGIALLLITGARILQRQRTKPVDWELVVAFIRRDFPPSHRDVAQEIAAMLAERVGFEIKQLRPEHTLNQIAEWAQDSLSVSAADLAELFVVEYGIECDANTAFRTLVEKVVEKQKKS
ncbi:MAG TPA: hypothetical protein VGR30_06330 [Candidatus Binatia bacterium]|jgi:hypothetical protein|nr:hypothetical protein [Candidatus Binatia bacterium]